MVNALLATILVAVAICVNGQGDPAEYPPVSWCDDDSLAKLVGVDKQCDAYSKAVYNKKVTLTMLYEALCPDCKNTINNVYPSLYATWKDYVNFEFVPYGNAKRTGSGFDCQHGTLECQLNQVATCALHFIDDLDIQFKFVSCMEGLSDDVQPDGVIKTCAPQSGATTGQQQSIAGCWNTDQGTQLEKAMADRTDNIFPVKHNWVPWILLNNASTHQIQDLLNGSTDQQVDAINYQICAIYRGDSVPRPCAAGAGQLSRAERIVASKTSRNCRK